MTTVLIAEWRCQVCEAEGIGGMAAMDKACEKHTKNFSHACVLSAVPVDSERGRTLVERSSPPPP